MSGGHDASTSPASSGTTTAPPLSASAPKEEGGGGRPVRSRWHIRLLLVEGAKAIIPCRAGEALKGSAWRVIRGETTGQRGVLPLQFLLAGLRLPLLDSFPEFSSAARVAEEFFRLPRSFLPGEDAGDVEGVAGDFSFCFGKS